VRIVRGFGRSVRGRGIARADTDARLAWLLIIGTVPAGLLGLALEHPLRRLFASPTTAAVFLFLNGLMLFAAERLRRGAPVRHGEHLSDERIARELTFGKGAAIGTAQAIALLPGFSRSGATMSGGLLAGLSNEDAARFAFLLATPVIGAVAALKLPDLLGPQGDGLRGPALVGALCAAASAYLSVRFLVRFFEINRLTPFAIYCTVAGALLTIGLAIA
jgi:undecaprenyl-diphosphatase